jgi:hypothetical protein
MIEVKINTNPDILPTQKEWRLICTMLRQQQAEIEQLKALVISLSPNSNLIYTKASKND